MKYEIAVAVVALSTIAFSAAAQKTQDSTSQHNTAAPDEGGTPVAPPPGRVCPIFSFPPHKVFQEEEKRLSGLFPKDRLDKNCLELEIREFNAGVEDVKKESLKCLRGGKPPYPTQKDMEDKLKLFQVAYEKDVNSFGPPLGCRRPLKR